jgi:hypothetical protein
MQEPVLQRLLLSLLVGASACALPHAAPRPLDASADRGGDVIVGDVADAIAVEDAAVDGGPDAEPPDVLADAELDADLGDAGRDALVDASPDALVDGGRDAPADVSRDVPVDAPVDVLRDVSVDAPVDVAIDAGREAGPEAGRDAGPEAGMDASPETGVDAAVCRTVMCGANCCRSGELCVGGECAASSCDAILMADPSAVDGVYRVAPAGLPIEPTYCRFNPAPMARGGWTLLQRSLYEFTGQTERLRTDYASFYSASVGTPAPGGAYRLPGRYWAQFSATGTSQQHLFVLTPRTVTNANCSALFFKVNEGRWEFSPTGPGRITGVSAEGLRFFHRNSATFSTLSDDTSASGCVRGATRGVPWAYAECANFSPGYTLGAQFDGLPRPILTDLESGFDLAGTSLAVSCGSATPLRSSETYEILSIAEYYIR